MAASPLHRRQQSVYAVGHTVVVERGRWMAAVLACGDAAVLSHAAAGALRGLRESDGSVVDVTVPGSGGRRRKQRIRVHRARSLDGQTTVKDRIPVTTPGRTILDLAAGLDRRGIERLLDRAEHARLGDELPLDELARAHTGHRRHAGLPKPTRVNDHVELLKADFVFAPSASSSGPTAGRALTTALDR